MSKAPLSQLEMTSHPLSSGSAWRNRVGETERGFTAGFRENSAFFFYFFTTSVLISFAVVLGLSGLQWAVLVLSVTVAIGSELLYSCVQKLKVKLKLAADDDFAQLCAMATAACMLLLAGSIMTIITLLGSRLYYLYG